MPLPEILTALENFSMSDGLSADLKSVRTSDLFLPHGFQVEHAFSDRPLFHATDARFVYAKFFHSHGLSRVLSADEASGVARGA